MTKADKELLEEAEYDHEFAVKELKKALNEIARLERKIQTLYNNYAR
jgi:hypothetical protein